MGIDIRKRFQEKDEERKERQRTLKQNSTVHLWFKHIADSLNESGMDMQVVLAKRAGIKWTETAVKECLFRVLMIAMTNKQSTTELTTKEFTDVTNMLRDFLARDYGLNVEVPSIETLMEERGA
jgi:hypothetical protein